jgi:hypothetical protein
MRLNLIEGLPKDNFILMMYNGFGLGAVERQPVRGENCAKPVLCVCGG